MKEKHSTFIARRILFCGLLVALSVFGVEAKSIENTSPLSGFYQLDVSKSANINTVVANASRQNNLSPAELNDLQIKLHPPETVSLETLGNQVSITSSGSNRVNLTANGQSIMAYGSNGTEVSIRSSLIGGILKIESIYDNTNYSITFRPVSDGRSMQVLRTVKTNYLRQTVFAESFYNRIVSSRLTAGNTGFANSDFIVPNGTVLAVVLENLISTKASQSNDRFRMTVQTEGEFEGALIEGHLSGIDRSNGITGTPKMTLNFETIKLPNGKTYNFKGIVQSIDISNPSIKTNNEGQVRGQNNTNESIKRGILGAGIGSVLGAIFDSKRGAVIGSIIGGVGGIGTVRLEGKKELEFKRGTQLNIQSTSPN